MRPSFGVTLLGVLLRQAAAALAASDWDIEALEMHHGRKIDAPSRTALLFGEEAVKGRGVALAANAVEGERRPYQPRKEGAIGFATTRGRGEHQARRYRKVGRSIHACSEPQRIGRDDKIAPNC
jgi:dihydrodipicolinate reductase